MFKDLRLVGGTALALQYGHRKSIDLDLFGKVDIDDISIAEELKIAGPVTILRKAPRILIYSINGIKVDLVNYPYPWIGELIYEEGLRLADSKDIGAMKLAAITGRGTKKDFYDLYFLLKQYSLKELLGFYREKFSDGSEFLVLKSLIYFEDAETDPDPLLLKIVTWPTIKQTITKAHTTYVKTL